MLIRRDGGVDLSECAEPASYGGEAECEIVAIAAGINPPVRGSTKTLPTCLVETEEEWVDSRALSMPLAELLQRQ